jgi:hypothetical protein
MRTQDIAEKGNEFSQQPGQDIPWMKSLTSCSNKMREMGYTEDFQVEKEGLSKFGQGTKVYKPEEVRIVNFYRFEGASDPGDNTIMYVIETNDGLKGTLVDGYGAYASDHVAKFIVQVEEIQKQIPNKNA